MFGTKDDNGLNLIISYMLIGSFFLIFGLGVFIFQYVIFHDYYAVEISKMATDMVNEGTMSSLWRDSIDYIIISSQQIINFADKIFMLTLAGFYMLLIRNSYYAKRVGYFTLFSLITFGLIFFLFMLSIYAELAEWSYNLFMSAIPSVVAKVPFYTWYIDNIGLVNLFVISICILVNFFHFNFTGFNSRKSSDLINNEIN